MVKNDLETIYLRSDDARMSLKEIAKRLRKTPQRIKYNITVLEKEGILKQPYCIFDYSRMGLILFRVYFRSAYVSESDKQKVIKELNENPYVVSIYELTGEFDLTVEFAAPNPSKFNKELKKLTMSIPKLNDYKIILNVVSYICPRNYLTKDEDITTISTEKIIGGDREKENFDVNEIKVMKNLLINPRIRLKDLAAKSELNIKTVQTIYKNLLKKNIIRGFRYIVDTNKLGISKRRLFLRLHNLSLERERQLTTSLIKIKEVVKINKTVGDWDIEIDIEALNKNRIRYIITTLREEFKDIIERFNIIEVYEYFNRNYLPKYFFEKERQENGY